LIGKEHTRNIDLVLLEIAGKRIFSFLNVSWAYTADIDFSSETLSFLGSAKFEVYGMFRGILKKDYPASLQFTSKNFDFNES
jgi:sphingosine kinase